VADTQGQFFYKTILKSIGVLPFLNQSTFVLLRYKVIRLIDPLSLLLLPLMFQRYLGEKNIEEKFV
jgi:hypothetical protein